MNVPDWSQAKSWPFVEARRVIERFEGAPPPTHPVVFETGYGPSGLPHIGTFGEVVRTTMVRHAFEAMTGWPARLVAFSDDMDGLRKVPDNIPNSREVERHLGKPLTAIPDPFGTHPSFGAHMNARLVRFLDRFEFDYELVSATEAYQSGRMNATLIQVLSHYEQVRDIVLPTLGAERQATYSPFLPVCPRTGLVLQVPIIEHDSALGTVSYADPQSGELVQVPVTDGHCKLQWKVDWAMRWLALDVSYEMYGKDLIDSAVLSGKIVRLLGGRPPAGFFYELFLDERGEKISKSKGNGLAVDEWLRYAPAESLSLFMFLSPRKAKRLYFDVIPRCVDDYRAALESYESQEPKRRLDNPVWHIHAGQPPAAEPTVSFALLLNLASACHATDAETLWGYVQRYAPGVTPASAPLTRRLIDAALAYYEDLVKPTLTYRAPSALEADALQALADGLAALPDTATAEAFQNLAYEVGKKHEFQSLRDWFRAVYEVLLGRSAGPRLGPFVALYGRQSMIELIERGLSGALALPSDTPGA